MTNNKPMAGDTYDLNLMAKRKPPEGRTGQLIVALNQPGMIDWTQTVVSGDNAQLALWALLAVLSAGMPVLLIVIRRKRKST